MKFSFILALVILCHTNILGLSFVSQGNFSNVFSDSDKYDSSYLIKKNGRGNFYFVRPNYKSNLLKFIDSIENFNDSGFNEINQNNMDTILKLNKETILRINFQMPVSPSELKIYDSLFAIKAINIKMDKFERLIYVLIKNVRLEDSLKYKFMLSFSIMYRNMYSGFSIDETRLDDMYYYYMLNSFASDSTNEFFCRFMSKFGETNNLFIKREIRELFDCRCIKKVIDEFEFCD
jgi:hypothetical protein